MEDPIKMDDLGVPLFSETSIYQSHGSVMGMGPLALGPMMEKKQILLGEDRPTPWKISMEHKHEGLEDHVPF